MFLPMEALLVHTKSVANETFHCVITLFKNNSIVIKGSYMAEKTLVLTFDLPEIIKKLGDVVYCFDICPN